MRKDIEIRNLSDIVNPELDVCTMGSTFSLLRLQCEGKIVLNPKRGPYIADSAHVELCRSALGLARANYVELFLTPEYSWPLELIGEIAGDQEQWPEKGKLWCLACQAQSREDFKGILDQWREQGAYVIDDAFQTAQRRPFVNPMIFVFQHEERLYLLVQLKILHMADPWCQCETYGLSLGKIIYRIGDRSSIQLYALLCADAMANIEISSLFPDESKHIVLVHPQLNPSPLSRHILRIRNTIFDTTEYRKKTIYITANWSQNTSLYSSGKSESLLAKEDQNPWSYVCCSGEKIEDELQQKNSAKGLYFQYDPSLHCQIWYANSGVHLQLLQIPKTYLNPCAVPAGKTKGIIAIEYWLPTKIDRSKAVAGDGDWIATEMEDFRARRISEIKDTSTDSEHIQCEKKRIEANEAPITGEDYFKEGIFYQSQGDYSTAISNYEKAANSIESPILWNNLGICYKNVAKYPEAEHCYFHSLEIAPQKYETKINLGILYFEWKKYQKAIENILMAITIDSENPEGYYHLGNLYQELKKFENAIGAYQKSLQLDSTNYSVWYNLGNAQKKIGKISESIVAYQKAAKINPNQYEVWNNLGIIYTINKEYLKAIQCYQNATIILPEGHAIWNNLGYVYIILEQYPNAIICIEKAIKIKSDIPQYYRTRAKYYQQIGKQELAKQDIIKAKQLEC